eukprot:m.133145 g.133145  ORF g.133145 m.133145 type:complete len:247 (+) comp38108_c0_seq1:108-848(+)
MEASIADVWKAKTSTSHFDQTAEYFLLQINSTASRTINTFTSRHRKIRSADGGSGSEKLGSVDNAAIVSGLLKYIIEAVRCQPGEKSCAVAEKGERGFPGWPGIQGQRGESGHEGPEGPRGKQGPTGESGSNGNTGLNGTRGETGSKGDRGDVGFKGDKGDKGEIGLAGPRGSEGRQGREGAQAEKGERGFMGEKGARGIQGRKGERVQLILGHLSGSLMVQTPGKVVWKYSAMAFGALFVTINGT